MKYTKKLRNNHIFNFGNNYTYTNKEPMEKLAWIAWIQLKLDKFIWCFQHISKDCNLTILSTTTPQTMPTFLHTKSFHRYLRYND